MLDIGAFELEDGQPADLVIGSTSVPSAIAGLPYVTTLTASGGVPPYAWLVVSGGLPSGVTLEQGSGRLVGTPTQTGTFAFSVRVSDTQAPADTAVRAFSLTVASAPAPPLIITHHQPPIRQARQDVLQTLVASGGALPYVWTIVAGSLPPGLSLSNTGILSGVPSLRGNWSFTVEVRDGQSPAGSARKALTLTVR